MPLLQNLDFKMPTGQLLPNLLPLLELFPLLTPDVYLLRQRHIEILQSELPPIVQNTGTLEYLKSYYAGTLNLDSLLQAIDLHTGATKTGRKKRLSLAPNRFRSQVSLQIVHSNINTSNEAFAWKDIASPDFYQTNATRFDAGFDWRRLPRQFPVQTLTDEQYLALKFLLMECGHRIAHHRNTRHVEFNVTVHFTKIICAANLPASNSPEGLHQDGMDYIVSAIVLRRFNVSGGASLVQNKDTGTIAEKRILEIGEGILQSDRGSTYWHCVEPIFVVNPATTGERWSIGLDFNLHTKP